MNIARNSFLSHNIVMVIDGKKIAADILLRLKSEPVPNKFLAAILVGDNPASISFLKQKEKVAQVLGVDFRLHRFAADSDRDDLQYGVYKLASDVGCGGIILQLPLPPGFDEQNILNDIPPEKDVDVLSERAVDELRSGKSNVYPPAVGTVREILESETVDVASTVFVVVGAGRLVGRPIAEWLATHAKKVSVVDKGDDFSVLKDADIVVSGTGVPGLISPDMLKKGAGIIDFGYGVRDGKTMGDFNAVTTTDSSSVSFYTPTPGGTGPILVAKLFENFYKLQK